METSLGSQGHPDPSPHPQLSLHPPQPHQAEVPEQWHGSATTDWDTEAEEGPGPRSQSRRHPCGLVLAQGCLIAIIILMVPITAPIAQLSIPPENHPPKGVDPSSTLLLPAPGQARHILPVVQPLQHRWLPQPCPLPQGCSLGEEAWDAGDAGDAGSKERGAKETHNPSKESHGGLSSHRCLTEPIHVQATCSPLQCSHLTRPSAPACCHRVLLSPQRPESN